MKATYQSSRYDSGIDYRRYARCDADGVFTYCLQDPKTGFDHVQGQVDSSELPDHVVKEARMLAGEVYGWVRWLDVGAAS
jgi:hypothetical protein